MLQTQVWRQTKGVSGFSGWWLLSSLGRHDNDKVTRCGWVSV